MLLAKDVVAHVLAPRFLRPRITQDSGIHKRVASAALGQIHSVLSTLRSRLQVAVTSVAHRVAIALREATRPLPLVAEFAMDRPGREGSCSPRTLCSANN